MTLTELLPTLTEDDKEMLTKLAIALKKLHSVNPPEPEPETYYDIVKSLKPKYAIARDLTITGYGPLYSNNQSSHRSAVYIVALIKLRNMCDFYNKEPMWMPEEMNKAYQLGRYGENNLVCTYIGYHGNAGLPLFKRHEDAMSALRKLTDEERIVVWGTKEIEL